MPELAQRLEPLDSRPLSDQTRAVTGASRESGERFSLDLDHCGAALVVNYRNSDEKPMEVTDIQEANDETSMAVGADVSNPVQVERIANEVRDKLRLHRRSGQQRWEHDRPHLRGQ